jgi:AmmeMemoRadiSam system protein A
MTLSLADRAALLGIARAAVLHRLGVAPAPALPSSGPLAEARGAFVTLHVAGALRGCIGMFKPVGTLAETVARMAVAASCEDPRFPAIHPGDIADMEVSVSVLSAVRPVDDPRKVEVGRHGVVVRRGLYRGTLLPKVAVEHGWDTETFLRHTCLKAGLPPTAWAEPGTEVEVFEADEFGEGKDA